MEMWNWSPLWNYHRTRQWIFYCTMVNICFKRAWLVTSIWTLFLKKLPNTIIKVFTFSSKIKHVHLNTWRRSKNVPKIPANIYFLKINNRNIRKWCKICSKSIMKTPERRHLSRSGVFIANFEHISHFF